jgi:hypothetical protein
MEWQKNKGYKNVKGSEEGGRRRDQSNVLIVNPSHIYSQHLTQRVHLLSMTFVVDAVL